MGVGWGNEDAMGSLGRGGEGREGSKFKANQTLKHELTVNVDEMK